MAAYELLLVLRLAIVQRALVLSQLGNVGQNRDQTLAIDFGETEGDDASVGADLVAQAITDGAVELCCALHPQPQIGRHDGKRSE